MSRKFDRIDKKIKRLTLKRAWLLDAEVRSTEDEIADTEFNLSKWGFSMRPSEKRRYKERIERLEGKLKRLTDMQERTNVPNRPPRENERQML